LKNGAGMIDTATITRTITLNKLSAMTAALADFAPWGHPPTHRHGLVPGHPCKARRDRASDHLGDDREEGEDPREAEERDADRGDVHLEPQRDEEDRREDRAEIPRALREIVSERGRREHRSGDEGTYDRGQADRLCDERVQERDGEGNQKASVLQAELHPGNLDANDETAEEVHADEDRDDDERDGRGGEDRKLDRVDRSLAHPDHNR